MNEQNPGLNPNTSQPYIPDLLSPDSPAMKLLAATRLVLDPTNPSVVSAEAKLAQTQRENDVLRGENAELAYRAERDPLTGLYNKQKFDNDLTSAMITASQKPFKLVFIDLEDFGLFNKKFDQTVGDHALRETSSALVSGLRDGDVLYRLGGDEFAIISYDDPVTDRRQRTEETDEERRSHIERRDKDDEVKMSERMTAISREATRNLWSNNPDIQEEAMSIVINYGYARLEGNDDGREGLIKRANEFAKKQKDESKRKKWEAALSVLMKDPKSFN